MALVIIFDEGLIGCRVDYLPSTYLGLPLGASYMSKVVWDPVVERFHKRLAGWKAKLLSRGRDFLWDSNNSGNGFHWVNWDEVCRPKQEGGLGIRPLRVMNEACKTKWL